MSRLAVARSVGQMGCEVFVIAMHAYMRGRKKLSSSLPIDGYSKYVSKVYHCHLKDERGLVHLLLTECVDPRQKVIIIPDSDYSASVIDRHIDELRDNFFFPHIRMTSGAVVEWMDKLRQKRLAKEVGLHVADAHVVRIVHGKYELPSSIHYPCFTKPLESISGGKKSLRCCTNEAELCHLLDFAAQDGTVNILIEDYKHIDNEYAVLGFSDASQVIIPGIIHITKMSQSHKGVAVQGQVIPNNGFEDYIAKFQEFIRRTEYVGAFDIDFYVSNGVLYFGELNLRFGGSGYAITKMGVNLPGMLVKTLIGEHINDMKKSISTTATYLNERTCSDDWYKGYITTEDYYQLIKSSDILFVHDSTDIEPQIAFEKEFRHKSYTRIMIILFNKLKSMI